MDDDCDWREIVNKKPRGYLELQNEFGILHGPVQNIEIDEENLVCINLKWAAFMFYRDGTPTKRWQALPSKKPITFPNMKVPFVIEETPGKGQCARFGLNVLYFDPVEGVDPSQVEGMDLPVPARESTR
jgi:hypothetical protein